MNGCRIIDDDAMSDGGQSVAVPDFPPTLKLEYYLQQLITVTKNQAEVPNALLQPNWKESKKQHYFCRKTIIKSQTKLQRNV